MITVIIFSEISKAVRNGGKKSEKKGRERERNLAIGIFTLFSPESPVSIPPGQSSFGIKINLSECNFQHVKHIPSSGILDAIILNSFRNITVLYLDNELKIKLSQVSRQTIQYLSCL